MKRDDIIFEIKEKVGVLTEYPTGWTKEVNLVSWDGGIPKIDVRDWDQNHEFMSRGIALPIEDAEKLRDILTNYEGLSKNEERTGSDSVFEIKEKIGVIACYPSGWTKEVNLVVWNGGTPKIDIRDWSKDHKHMSRGITFPTSEAEKLRDFLSNYKGLD